MAVWGGRIGGGDGKGGVGGDAVATVHVAWHMALALALCAWWCCVPGAEGLGLDDGLVYFSLHQPRDVAYVYPTLPALDFGSDFMHVYRNTHLVPSAPVDGCQPFTNGFSIEGHVALIQRGTCTFLEKAFHAEQAGAVAAIIYNSAVNDEWIDMMGEGVDYSVHIPALFMLGIDAQRILDSLHKSGAGTARITIPLNQTFSPLSFRPWAEW